MPGAGDLPRARRCCGSRPTMIRCWLRPSYLYKFALAGMIRQRETARRPVGAAGRSHCHGRTGSGRGDGRFLTTSRFRRRALSESLSSLVLTQPVVEPAIVLHRAQPVGRHAQAHRTLQRVRDQRLVLRSSAERCAWSCCWRGRRCVPCRPLPVSSQMRDMVSILNSGEPGKSARIAGDARSVNPIACNPAAAARCCARVLTGRRSCVPCLSSSVSSRS